MKTIYPTAILDYYDGVLAFEGRDAIGGHYIGAAVKPEGGYDRYLVTGVRPERLQKFRSGVLDLRTLLLEAPGGEWYITLTNSDPGDALSLEPQYGPLAETDLLPDDGYTLGIIEPVGEPEVQQALASGKAVTLVGEIDRVNRSSGDWALLTDAGVKSGKTAQGGAALNGLQIGKRYRFRCAVINESDAFWRNRPTLYLARFESV